MLQQEAIRLENNLNHLFNFAHSVIQPMKTPQWVKVEHRCPKCNKAVTDLVEFNYMQDSGECLTHDHVRGELC